MWRWQQKRRPPTQVEAARNASTGCPMAGGCSYLLVNWREKKEGQNRSSETGG